MLMHQQPKKIYNLQVLRAFAAISVVFFHAVGVADSYGYKATFFEAFKTWGSCGVDLFFVLSGFVMVFIQSHSPKPPLAFLKNRIKRIVPMYWAMTFLLALVLYLQASLFRESIFDLGQTTFSLLFLSKMLGYAHPVVSPGWTLELEMFFYGIFALGISFKKLETAMFSAFILLIGVCFFGLDNIVIEFIFGMFLAKIYLKNYFKKNAYLFFAVGAVGLLSGLFFKLDISRVYAWGVPSAFLVLSTCYLPQMKNRFCLFLGEASYSIYLVHTFGLLVFYKILAGLTVSAEHADFWLACGVAFSVCVGCLMHLCLEKPLDIFIKSSFSIARSLLTAR